MPILFAFIGGVIAYLAVRDRDSGVAKLLLLVGVAVTVILYLLFF